MVTYTVKKGDTLWDIARKHGISFEHLIQLNPEIINADLIYPGQIINIGNQNNNGYIVKKGDTLWNISLNHGVSLNHLLEVNPQITNPHLIYPDQIINIPGMTPSPPSSPTTPATPSDIRALENEVIRLVNVERERAGVAALTENAELSNIARLKSQDFIDNNYFAHNSPTYGSPFDMIRSFSINYTAAAENIARGQRTASEVMSYWMNSEGHRANILNSTYNEIGVGVARDNNGNLYWTQLFIRK